MDIYVASLTPLIRAFSRSVDISLIISGGNMCLVLYRKRETGGSD